MSAQRRHEQSLLDAQAELARTEARLRTMIETMDAAVSMYDARHRLMLCNERFRLGYGPLAPRVPAVGAARQPARPVTARGGRARPEGGMLVEVSDRGPGLPEDEFDAVFERFAQSRRTRHGGAGLGLAICRAIVEAHGARIAARNNPGGGSTFWFELPAATPNDHQPEQLHAA